MFLLLNYLITQHHTRKDSVYAHPRTLKVLCGYVFLKGARTFLISIINSYMSGYYYPAPFPLFYGC